MGGSTSKPDNRKQIVQDYLENREDGGFHLFEVHAPTMAGGLIIFFVILAIAAAIAYYIRRQKKRQRAKSLLQMQTQHQLPLLAAGPHLQTPFLGSASFAPAPAPFAPAAGLLAPAAHLPGPPRQHLSPRQHGMDLVLQQLRELNARLEDDVGRADVEELREDYP